MTEATEFNRKIFNKGARRIDHDRGALHPQTASAFTVDEADRLLRLFKSELIDMDNVTVDSLVNSGAADKLASDSKKDAEDIARRLADARILRKQTAYENAVKEGFEDAEAREIAGLEPVAKIEGATEADKA